MAKTSAPRDPALLAQLDMMIELSESIAKLNSLLASPQVEFITPNINLDSLPRPVDTAPLEETVRQGDRAIVMAIEQLALRLQESTKAAGTRMGSFSGGSSQTVVQAHKVAVVTSVAASASTVTLLEANPNRKRVILHNDSSNTVFVKCGDNAANNDFSVRLIGQASYELFYTGRITAVWVSASGNMRITEFS